MSYRVLSPFSVLLLASPTIATAQSFSGPHAEAVVGWNHVDTQSQGRSGDGAVYGGGVGYDLRSGAVVGGVLAEASDSSGSTCRDVLAAGTVAGTGCGHNGRSLFAGARLGYAVGEHGMLYVLGGYANVRQRFTYESGSGVPVANLRDTRDRDAYRVGAGVERVIAGRAFVKAEYRYTDAKGSADVDQHQVVTGIGIRF